MPSDNACQGEITRDREGDPSVPDAKPDPSAWEEFEGLKNALERLDLEKKRKTSAGTTLTAQLERLNVADFLADECRLKL